MKKLAKYKVPIFIVAFIFGLYLYYVPVQRSKAERAVNVYMEQQEVDFTQIESKRVQKDWTLNAHHIYITFKNDPGKTYEYHYKKHGGVSLWVRDELGMTINSPNDVKYPWLYRGYVIPHRPA